MPIVCTTTGEQDLTPEQIAAHYVPCGVRVISPPNVILLSSWGAEYHTVCGPFTTGYYIHRNLIPREERWEKMRVRREGIEARYRTNASAAAGTYVSEATSPETDWETPTMEAEGDWQEGVARAAEMGFFSAGVRRAGNAKYKERIAAVGESRYRTGVTSGSAEYAEKMAPFLNALEAMTLPPKTDDIDANIDNRMRPVAHEMRRIADLLASS